MVAFGLGSFFHQNDAASTVSTKGGIQEKWQDCRGEVRECSKKEAGSSFSLMGDQLDVLGKWKSMKPFGWER